MTIRSLLSEAHGYVVVDSEGRRVGTFIELAARSESSRKRAAIRRDRIFLWHRLLLPLEAIETVVPESRVVVLAVDRRTLDRPHELENERLGDVAGDPNAEAQSGAEWLTQRLEHYAPGGKSHSTDGEAVGRSGLEPRLAATVDETHPRGQGDDGDAPKVPAATPPERHLLFVPTSQGYFLAEREGPPPPLAGEVEAPELSGSFTVAKLAPSPLPDDARTCAYLEPIGSRTGR
jgi:hypothetical protein